MGEVKAPLWAWDLLTPVLLGLTAWRASAGRMDGDPRRLPVGMRSPGAPSDRGFLVRITACLDGRGGKDRWKKDKRKSRRATGQGGGHGRSLERPERVSRRLPHSVSFFVFSPSSPFPFPLSCPVGCSLPSVDFVPREPSLEPVQKDEPPAPTGCAGTLQLQTHKRTQSLGLGLGLVTLNSQTDSSPLEIHLRQLMSAEHARRSRPLQPSCSGDADDAASTPWYPTSHPTSTTSVPTSHNVTPLGPLPYLFSAH
ncbi:hypothetical protein QBC39DRAFT_75663 [Podospora conica]|nr:hypothetical protein QBC39DRAFT_75663 [Schizothecium conicum]